MSQPASIDGFHHVAIHSTRYDESVAFYRDVLGLKHRVEFELEGRRVSLLDAGAGAHVEIFDVADTPQPGDRPLIVHFALRTNRVDHFIAKVRESGMQIDMEPTTLDLPTRVGPDPMRIRIAFFFGPDGEHVELFDQITPLD